MKTEWLKKRHRKRFEIHGKRGFGSFLFAGRSILLGAVCLMVSSLSIWMPDARVCASAGQAPEVQREAGGEEKLRSALHAHGAVLLDGESGRMLFGKNAEEPLANASTTKIMTCIVAMENPPAVEQMGVSRYAASMPKVKLFVQKGEHYRFEDLLHSMMLESHNDSACVIAENIGKEWVEELKGRDPVEFSHEESRRAVHAFAERMNRLAEEIGCADTYFITPNGLDEQETTGDSEGNIRILEHHTTALDLAKILAYCVNESPRRERFLKVTGCREYHFTCGGRSFQCTNRNQLLDRMEGVVSGKTGYTGKAGYCYVGAMKKGDHFLVVALLACGWPNQRDLKWQDAEKLMTYGLKNFHRVIVPEQIPISEEILEPIPVESGCPEKLGEECLVKLRALPDGASAKGVLLREPEKIRVVVTVADSLEAPVTEGKEVGSIRYVLDEEVLCTTKIVAAQGIPRIDLTWCLRTLWHYFAMGEVGWSL